MIILIEPDKEKTKKLCDIIHRERVIPVDSPGKALDFVVRFYKEKKDIDLIIGNSNVPHFYGLVSKNILEKLSRKLGILYTIPLIGYYEEENEKIEEIRDHGVGLIKYDEKDSEFPFRYMQLIREKYPNLNIDVRNLREIWLGLRIRKGKKSTKEEKKGIKKILDEVSTPAEILEEKRKEELMDITGISEQVKEIVPKEEYQELEKKYNALKKEHEDLKEYFKDLIDTVEK
ncbi:MAG: hypothetical protein IB618_02345 [Candidatus Pacearchaeota archaeon]|nr:MAG: hypothetical protein IB618_02345 [Candidatus Pacearchaeota archaeon]